MRWITALLATTVLAGSAATATAQTELTFRFNDPEADAMRAALDRFEEAHPDISVELERIAWKDAQAQFLREAAVGQGPDVVHIAFVWTKDMGDAGALMPLDDMIESDPPGAGFDDFIANDLVVGSDGQRYGLPWTTDTWAMLYRADILEEVGHDSFPSDWEGLFEFSRTIHEETGKVGFGIPAGSGGSNSIWFLANYYWWSHGKALIEETGDGGFAIGLEESDVVEMLDYYARFFEEAGLPQVYLGAAEWFDPTITEGLVTGDQAIAIMPPATASGVISSFEERNPEAENPFRSAKIPAGSAGSITHLGGRTLGINANTDHPEASWELLTFLLTEEIFTDYYTAQFPAQRSLLDAIAFEPAMQGFAEQLQEARTWGAYAASPAQIGSLWNEAGRIFGAALSGQMDHDEAARTYLDYARGQLEG